MKKYFLYLVLLIGVYSLNSCNSDVFFEEQKSINNAVWNYSDSLQYKFEIKDTSQRYDMSLRFDYSEAFAYQNVYLQLHTTFPDGKKKSKVISFELFDATGKVLGKGTKDACKVQIMLQENAWFNQSGNYTLTINQNMRTDQLAGISQVGLVLTKHGVK
jgi:gliding motility-associated lipoprotein GldH